MDRYQHASTACAPSFSEQQVEQEYYEEQVHDALDYADRPHRTFLVGCNQFLNPKAIIFNNVFIIPSFRAKPKNLRSYHR